MSVADVFGERRLERERRARRARWQTAAWAVGGVAIACGFVALVYLGLRIYFAFAPMLISPSVAAWTARDYETLDCVERYKKDRSVQCPPPTPTLQGARVLWLGDLWPG